LCRGSGALFISTALLFANPSTIIISIYSPLIKTCIICWEGNIYVMLSY
jgi:hypothetical protein